jgi:hypothetical protein
VGREPTPQAACVGASGGAPPSQRSLRPDFAAAVNGWRVRFRVGWRWRVQKYFSFADRKMLTRIDFHG